METVKQQILAKAQKPPGEKEPPNLAVATIRMSRDLYARLQNVAWAERRSMNRLARAAIEQAVELLEQPAALPSPAQGAGDASQDSAA